MKNNYNTSLGVINQLNSIIKEDDVKLPDAEDLKGAVKAIIRLQKIYSMNATSIADGQLNGVQYNT